MSLWNVLHRLLFPCAFWGGGGLGGGGWAELVKSGVWRWAWMWSCSDSNVFRAIPLLSILTSADTGWTNSLWTEKVAGAGWTHHLSVCPTSHSQPVSANGWASLSWLPGMWHRQPDRPVRNPYHLFPSWALPPSGAWLGSLEPRVGQTELYRGPRLYSEGILLTKQVQNSCHFHIKMLYVLFLWEHRVEWVHPEMESRISPFFHW